MARLLPSDRILTLVGDYSRARNIFGTCILVVDDEWRLGDKVARYLRRKGCPSFTVTGVTEVNQAMLERRPELAVVDRKLPDRCGIDLCRRFNPRYPDMPVMVMSARVDSADEKILRDLGIRGFILKPFALADLVGAPGLGSRVSGSATGACGDRTVIAARPAGETARIPECPPHTTGAVPVSCSIRTTP